MKSEEEKMTKAQGEEKEIKVLVAGGFPDSKSAELYNPASGTWTPTGQPCQHRTQS